IGGGSLLQMREVRTLNALLSHPHVTRIEGYVEARGAGAKNDHAAALDHHRRHRKRLLARVLEHDVDVALAGDVPDRLAEAARLLRPFIELGRVDLRQLTPAVEILSVDDAFGTEIENIIGLGIVRHDSDRVRA